jgi:hypothetical protein
MKHLVSSVSIDALIVDEAGQALESDLLVSLCSKPLSMILAGDPKQLPATILSTEAIACGMNISTMQRLQDIGSPCTVLDTQYRMHPHICQFPNSQFYDGKLKTSATVMHNLATMFSDKNSEFSRFISWFDHYRFINISSPESGGGCGNMSKRNVGEAKLIAR